MDIDNPKNLDYWVGMSTTSHIIESIGRKQIEASLNVKRSVISKAVVENVFPAAWFNVIERLCVASGIDCPRELFNWRGKWEVAPKVEVTDHQNNSTNTHRIAS